LNLAETLKFFSEPTPIGMKVIQKRISATSQMLFNLLLFSTGNGEDAITTKGTVRGMKDFLRYGNKYTASGYKMYDFVTHKKNDLSDILLMQGIR
jgi:hypothetical protein